MSAPRPPDRVRVSWAPPSLLGLVALPIGAALLLLIRWPHPGLRALIAFWTMLPLGWALAATVLVRRAARCVRLGFAPVTGPRHALGELRVGLELAHAGGGPGAVCLEVWQNIVPPDGGAMRLVPRLVSWLAPGTSRALAWAVRLRERGRARLATAHVWCELPGSLQAVLLSWDDGRAWTVGPARYRLRGEVLELLSGRRQASGRMVVVPSAGEEMCGLREYRPGDSPRMIAWSRSLRAGPRGPELAVREYEDPSDEDVCLVIDVHVPAGPESLTRRWHMEKAVAFTAAFTRLLLARRYRVRLRAAQASGRLDLVLGGQTRDDERLDDALAALAPLDGARAVDDLLFASIREARGAVLFVSLRPIAQEEVDRRLPVVSVLPGWIDHLVTGVVGL